MKRALALATCALTLVACGTTVRTGSELSSGTSTGTDLGIPTTDPTTQLTDPGTALNSTPDAQAPSSEDSTSTAPDAVVDPGTSVTSPVLSVPKTPVKVGYFTSKDTGAAFQSLGYSGLSSGNPQAQVAAAVKLVNSRGGIGGRQISPVVFAADPTTDPETTSATACASFFEDNHVQVVVSVYYTGQLAQCAKKHNVPFVVEGNTSTSDASLGANPALVLVDQLSIEKIASTMTKGLIDTGWLSAGQKPVIGLITHDTPDFSKVPGLVSAALAKAGLKLTATAYMPTGSIPQAATAGKAAALKFKASGVDHVLGVDAGGFGLSWFTLNAGQQGYYPKIGLSSLSLPGAFPTIFTPRQLTGSVAIGWAPILDNGVAQQQPVGPRTTACINAAKAAGEDMSAQLARQEALVICDATFLLSDALKTGEVSVPAFTSGLRALSTFQSAVTFKALPSRSRAFVGAFKTDKYDPSCSCYKYSGGLHAIG